MHLSEVTPLPGKSRGVFLFSSQTTEHLFTIRFIDEPEKKEYTIPKSIKIDQQNASVMQNGDFPGNSAKSLDYLVFLYYKKGYENHNGVAWAFLIFD